MLKNKADENAKTFSNFANRFFNLLFLLSEKKVKYQLNGNCLKCAVQYSYHVSFGKSYYRKYYIITTMQKNNNELVDLFQKQPGETVTFFIMEYIIKAELYKYSRPLFGFC